MHACMHAYIHTYIYSYILPIKVCIDENGVGDSPLCAEVSALCATYTIPTHTCLRTYFTSELL